MTNEENSLFENLNFNPFNFESILLNKSQDPDEILFENFKNSSYLPQVATKEAVTEEPVQNLRRSQRHAKRPSRYTGPEWAEL